jgi:hypothetical protein
MPAVAGEQKGTTPMVSVDTLSNSAPRGVVDGTGSVWMARLSRFGFGARAVTYVLLAYLSIRVAFGQSSWETDREGAMRTIARQPLARPILVALAVGFASYGVWQLSIAAFGRSARAGSDRLGRRTLALANGVLYGFFCASAVAFALGSSRAPAGGNKPEVDWTGKVMRHTFGRPLVGAVGIALIVTAVVLVWLRLSGKHEVELRQTSSRTRRYAERLGDFGSTARAVILGAAGVFFIQAAVHFNPRKAKGLDGTLKSFAHTPAGPSLLVLVAAGLVAFGLYSLAEARYAAL